MSEPRKTDGARLRRLRSEWFLSQEELAKKAGVGITTIHRIESGDAPHPRLRTLVALAKALEVHPEELLEVDEEEGTQEHRPFSMTPSWVERRNGLGGNWDFGEPSGVVSGLLGGGGR